MAQAGTKITELFALTIDANKVQVALGKSTDFSAAITNKGNNDGTQGVTEAPLKTLNDIKEVEKLDFPDVISAKISTADINVETFKKIGAITDPAPDTFAIAFAAEKPKFGDVLAANVFATKSKLEKARMKEISTRLKALSTADNAKLIAHPILHSFELQNATDSKVIVKFNSILCDQLIGLGDPATAANIEAAKLKPIFEFLHDISKEPAIALANADVLLAEYLETDAGKKLSTKPLLNAFLAEVAKVEVGTAPTKVFADIAKQTKVAAVLGKLPEKAPPTDKGDESLDPNKGKKTIVDGKTESIAAAFDKAGFKDHLTTPTVLLYGGLFGTIFSALVFALLKVLGVEKMEIVLPSIVTAFAGGLAGNVAFGLGGTPYIAGEITAESSKATIDDADNRKFIAEAIGAKSIDTNWMVTMKEGETPVPFDKTHREKLEGKVGGDAKGKWAKVVEAANADKTKTAETAKGGKTT